MEDKKWQLRLLPLMTTMISLLAIFFFVATLFQLYRVHDRISESPKIDQSDIEKLDSTAELKLLAILEKNLVENRYHQANTSLMNRIWLKYLGFITGMILSFVGAVFILGKMRIDESKFKLDLEKAKLNFITSSPGIILTLLGTFLMVTTIVTHHSIDVKDASIYINYPVTKEDTTSPKYDTIDPEQIGTAEKKPNTGKRPK